MTGLGATAVVGAGKWLMQLGTLSGNPVASAAGLKTLEILRRSGQYEQLRTLGQKIMDAQTAALTEAGVPHRLCGDPTLFDVYFTDTDPVDYRSARHRDDRLNDAFNAELRRNGVFKSPGKLYPSLALTGEDLQVTVGAVERASRAVAERMAGLR